MSGGHNLGMFSDGAFLATFCAHFGLVLGRLAGAWCDTGQADDSVDSLMHGHTM